MHGTMFPQPAMWVNSCHGCFFHFFRGYLHEWCNHATVEQRFPSCYPQGAAQQQQDLGAFADLANRRRTRPVAAGRQPCETVVLPVCPRVTCALRWPGAAVSTRCSGRSRCASRIPWATSSSNSRPWPSAPWPGLPPGRLRVP